MTNKEKKIKEYWDEQARQYKDSPQATAPDVFYRELEISRIISCLKDNARVLDVGCGNGFSTFKFAQKFPGLNILGIDYAQEMIRQATLSLAQNKKLQKRVGFEVGDVLQLSRLPFLKEKFDYIVSERCLINLINWEQQKRALLEMKKVLKKNGRIILCENTQEGLGRLNLIRKRLGLKAIALRWHNYYLPEKKFLDFAARHFILEDVNNIGSLYYIISRVVYAKLCEMAGREPDYLNPINKIASQLPSLGNYSPNFIFLLMNKPL